MMKQDFVLASKSIHMMPQFQHQHQFDMQQNQQQQYQQQHQQVFHQQEMEGTFDEIHDLMYETTDGAYPSEALLCAEPTVDLPTLDTNLDHIDPYNMVPFPQNQLITLDPERTILKTFPNLMEHDDEKYCFELNLGPQTCEKTTNWLYSKDLRRLYIRLDQAFNIDVEYRPKIDDGQLFVRVMMVFIDDVSAPVGRCHNHCQTDNSNVEGEEKRKWNVIRSENAGARYIGTQCGKYVNDRLAVIIPIGNSKPNEFNICKEIIALKFVCQNSCLGRRMTALIFTLENAAEHVLSKKTVNVKICSCPKRDKDKDEKRYRSEKRGPGELECPPGKRIKKEPTEVLTPPPPSPAQSVSSTGPGVSLHLDLPDNKIALSVCQSAYDRICGQMASEPDRAQQLGNYLPGIATQIKKIKKIIASEQQNAANGN